MTPRAGDTEARDALEAALFEVKRVIVGQEDMLERLLVALLAGGHVLLEGVPGLAKTLTVSTLADVLGGSFRRVQFTPDLVPADLVGTRVLRPGMDGFDIELGPVHTNVLLADEVNRAPAKVQSALLEVMQERQVSIGGQTFPVPRPFLVLATQNPIESEGTYPLPEAQVDRFMFKLLLDYPSDHEEVAIVARSLDRPAVVERVLAAESLERFQAAARDIYVDRAVAQYAVNLVACTRRPLEFGVGELLEQVEFGASPRGSLNLVHAAQALALLRGRHYALPRDVRDLARDILRHRLVLTYEALAEGVTPDVILDRVLAAVSEPEVQLSRGEERDARLERGPVRPEAAARSVSAGEPGRADPRPAA
ncbi:MAG TPA: MoxR family ATPase [Solirubrobacteraceae bacterium]|nr:MoxR family ATPase [Solirubrobacteraceae bacterium]